uniref:SREBP regulating gene protein n=2 Tax=Palpitomonas bilix TaxID=652834 RepID=A0A7S3GAS1_9EUKA|mmetsp:Transcript_36291/g.94396  ORF Transcript_36291/g.94396 Transcript_36291/m.94396 type:complete len:404 (+) Transcript_36291:312-1523(+)
MAYSRVRPACSSRLRLTVVLSCSLLSSLAALIYLHHSSVAFNPLRTAMKVGERNGDGDAKKEKDGGHNLFVSTSSQSNSGMNVTTTESDDFRRLLLALPFLQKKGSKSDKPKECESVLAGPHSYVDSKGYRCVTDQFDRNTGCCRSASVVNAQVQSGEDEKGSIGSDSEKQRERKRRHGKERESGEEHDYGEEGTRSVTSNVEVAMQGGALVKNEGVVQYACDTCVSNTCCTEYDDCVSCCLSPSNERTIEEALLKQNLHRNVKAAKEISNFQYCAMACRHYSNSVVHENSYLTDFHHCYTPDMIPSPPLEEVKFVTLLGKVGADCESTCKAKGKKCERALLSMVNTCDVLRQKFECEKCEESFGYDQPCLDERKKSCFYNKSPTYFSCDGKHAATARLCTCV